jgi:hypothetical protein
MQSLTVYLNNQTINRYYSATQDTVASGLFIKYYTDLFKNIGCYKIGNPPSITKNDFDNYFNLYCFSLTTDGKYDRGYLPICKTGSARVQINYKHPVPNSEKAQIMYILGVYPSIIELNNEGVFTSSYRTS